MQDLSKDAGMKFIREDFCWIEDMSFLTSAGETRGSLKKGVPLKGALSGGVEELSFAFMDCFTFEIVLRKKLEKLEQNSRFSSSVDVCLLSDESSSSLTAAQQDFKSEQELIYC